MNRRSFAHGAMVLPWAGELVTPQEAEANPAVAWVLRSLIWPAIENLGAVIVQGVAAAVEAYFIDKAVDFAVDAAMGKMCRDSRLYSLATRAKKIYSAHKLINGILTVAEAVHIVWCSQKPDGEPILVWGRRKSADPSEPAEPFCRMTGPQLVLIDHVREKFLGVLSKDRVNDPAHNASDEDLAQAFFVPVTEIKAGPAAGSLAKLFVLESQIAFVRILMSEATTNADGGVDVRCDASIYRKTLGGGLGERMWSVTDSRVRVS